MCDDIQSNKFISALKNKNLEELRKVAKADLHNHFVLGGSAEYIRYKTGYNISHLNEPISSMGEMHLWADENIGSKFNNTEMRELLIEACFYKAKEDGVKILEIGEDVWGLGEYFHNDIKELISAFTKANKKIAPEIKLRLQIGLSRHCDVNYLLSCLKYFWGRKEFYSIDLYGDELSQPIENFIPIYKKAKENGLKLKAHVGEWGTAEDVKKAVELLHLDEVQHGIAAVDSIAVVDFLAKNKIILNVTPSSNYFLSRVKSIKEHPIAKLYRSGVKVTINSDDILMFDSDVSKEYLRLYENNVLSAEELNEIRIFSLSIQ